MDRKRKQAVAVADRVGTETEEIREGSGNRSPNNVRKIREALLLSKAELARKAGVSALTIDRIESGYSCRMDTKRKIILALGMKLSDKNRVFGPDEPEMPR